MQTFQFPTWVNKFTVVLFVCVASIGGYGATLGFFATHPNIINVGHAPIQPVPFSHKIHAGQLKLDCRYCHNTVEISGQASVPPTATCGNCHGGNLTKQGANLSVVHMTSEKLSPVRESLQSGDPVQWKRVHEMPDFVYFNHSAHVNKGVSCLECHGRVDRMDVVTQVKPLSMKFCLNCHRDPSTRLRPAESVTDLGWEHPEGTDPAQFGKELQEKFNINPTTNCSTCHR